jgi:hypothetical protein
MMSKINTSRDDEPPTGFLLSALIAEACNTEKLIKSKGNAGITTHI